ncbi:MAG: hypothetical protein HQM06_09880 [Magnetococcales bacterium]|nr:hypothetical protein [Magnetococcales bacterium]
MTDTEASAGQEWPGLAKKVRASHWMTLHKACNLFLFGQQEEMSLLSIGQINDLMRHVEDEPNKSWCKDDDSGGIRKRLVDLRPFMLWAIQGGHEPSPGLLETLEGHGIRFGDGNSDDHQHGREWGLEFKARVRHAILEAEERGQEDTHLVSEKPTARHPVPEADEHRLTVDLADMARLVYPGLGAVVSEWDDPSAQKKTAATNGIGCNGTDRKGSASQTGQKVKRDRAPSALTQLIEKTFTSLKKETKDREITLSDILLEMEDQDDDGESIIQEIDHENKHVSWCDPTTRADRGPTSFKRIQNIMSEIRNKKDPAKP